jgi:hypothetical protein
MPGVIDRSITAITVGCLIGAFFAWSRLTGLATDGLTFSEWTLGILGGVFVGGGTGLVGYYGTRWIGGRFFDDEDDQ